MTFLVQCLQRDQVIFEGAGSEVGMILFSMSFGINSLKLFKLGWHPRSFLFVFNLSGKTQSMKEVIQGRFD